MFQRYTISVRRGVIGLLLAANLFFVVTTCWRLSPLLRQNSIRTHFSDATPPFWWPQSWKQEWKVRGKLTEHVTLEFIETPLADICDFLTDVTQQKFTLDTPALKLEGISGDTPTNVESFDVSIRTGLRIVLDQLDMTYVIRSGTVVLTTKIAARAARSPQDNPVLGAFGIESLSDRSVQVRREAAFALSWNPKPRILDLPRLASSIRDEDREVRINVAATLGDYGWAALPTLLHALDDGDETVRRTACASIRRIGSRNEMDSSIRNTLIQSLRSDNPRKMAGAAYALFAFAHDDPEVMRALIAAYNENDGPDLIRAMMDIRCNTISLAAHELRNAITAATDLP